jgi:spore germination cell wall hydrolase CwlJ-like protein
MSEDWELRLSCDVVFLALGVWREARGEIFEGKLAVACSIMNRVNRPSWWGKTVLEVMTKKWQYSSMTDPKDKQLTMWPTKFDPVWMECLAIARGVRLGQYSHPAPGADTYHDISIATPPSWGDPPLVKQIGRLKFFDMDKDIERSPT